MTFGPGTKAVGSDIPAGTYRSTSTNALCEWSRLAGLSGAPTDVIAFGIGPLQIATVAPSDVGFSSSAACVSWTEVEATYPPGPATSFGDGMFVVGRHIAAGTYRSASSVPCYWQRLSGFSGDAEADVIADDFRAQPTVTIQATDTGFLSDGCGAWSRQ